MSESTKARPCGWSELSPEGPTPGQGTKRHRCAFVALLGFCFAAGPPGCAKSQRRHQAVWPRQIAAGRPPTCPDGAVDVYGDGTPGPDDARCSYADASGRMLVQLRGTVLAQMETGGLAQPRSDTVVTLHAVESPKPGRRRGSSNPSQASQGSGQASQGSGQASAAVLGPALARARTDAQGAFSLSVMLRPGRYALQVGQTRHELEIRGDDLEPVRVLVPSAGSSGGGW